MKLKIPQAERDYYNEQMTANKGNTGAMWKTIRSALPNKSRQRPQYTKDTDTLANEFNKFFISVGERAANESIELARRYALSTEPVSFCQEYPVTFPSLSLDSN